MRFLWPALFYLPSLHLSDKGSDTGRDLAHPRSSTPSSAQLRGWRFLGSGVGVRGETCPGSQSEVIAGPHQEAEVRTLGHTLLPSCLGAPSRLPVSAANGPLARCRRGIPQPGLLIINAYILSWPRARFPPPPPHAPPSLCPRFSIPVS